MSILTLWQLILYHRGMLWFLFICNLLGTIYGYYWYSSQLEVTQPIFWVFVPDSPTATLFLTFSIVLWLWGKGSSIIEGLAFTSLFKYGTWAVIMNVLMFYDQKMITITGVMLILSHGVMAIQALYFAPRMTFSISAFIISMIWLYHNDVIDYVFKQFPVYPFIEAHISAIGYLTFWLSTISLILYIYSAHLKKNKIFDQF